MTFKRSLTLLSCCLGTFLLLVHTTSATVSVSVMQADLHAGFADGQWIINAFTVAVGALLIAAGALGDAVGHRRVFNAGMVVFAVATTACGLAPTVGILILGRLMQGAGGAVILASMIPLIVHTYLGRRRAAALSLWSIASAAGGAVGTLGSGVLAHPVTWRWLFLGSVPLALVALAAGLAAPAGLTDEARRRGHLDLGGVAWTVVFAGSATFTIISSGESGLASFPTLGAMACAVVGLVGLVVTERWAENPALPLALFRSRAFVGTITTGFAYYLAAFGPLPVLANWLATSSGMPAGLIGVLLSLQQVGFALVAGLVRVPERRHEAALLLGLGLIEAGVLFDAVTVFASWPGPLVLIGLILSGAGAGVMTPILPSRATGTVAPSLAGAAAGSFNASRQLGLGFGVAACSAVARVDADDGTGPGLSLVLAASVAVLAGVTQWVLRDVGSVGVVGRERRGDIR